MVAVTTNAGLCPRCRRRPGCEVAVAAVFPVWLCDRFQDGEAADRVEEGLADLCSTCTQKTACDLARPEGGVWHCESYVCST